MSAAAAAEATQRPSRTTMAGMLWNAEHVLDRALDPCTNGVPRDLFKACKGVVLVSIVEAGFIFCGNVGTGVIMAKRGAGTGRSTGDGDDGGDGEVDDGDDGDDRWSPPSALGLAGVGFGLLVGAEIKDLVIFIMDDGTMDAFTGEAQLKIGAELSLTMGPLGREAQIDMNMSNQGVGGSVAYSFSKGLFAGAGLETALLGVRPKENASFYGKALSPREILYGDDGAVVAAANAEGTGVPELHRKLALLQRGESADKPTASELRRKESMREEANREAQKAREQEGADGQEDVIEVDAHDEAEKERMGEKTAWSVLHAGEERPDAAERVEERKAAAQKAQEDEEKKKEKTGYDLVHDD